MDSTSAIAGRRPASVPGGPDAPRPPRDAGTDFGTLLGSGAQGAEAAFAAGQDAYQRGRFADAETFFRQAMESGGDSAFLHNFMGAALQMQGRPAEAARSYRAALARDPDYADAGVNLSRVTDGLVPPDGAVMAMALAEREVDAAPNSGPAVPPASAARAYARALPPPPGGTLSEIT